MNGKAAERSHPLRWFIGALSGYVLLTGIVTLTGWFIRSPRLTDWLNSGISMFPNTAIAAALIGAALLLRVFQARWGHATASALGAGAALLGGVTLAEHLLGVDFGIDTLLVTDGAWSFRGAAAPGRMGPPACVSFLLLGTALVLMRHERKRRLVPACAILTIAIASLGLIGYGFNANNLFSIAKITGIAMPTATMLLAAGVAVLASVPDLEPVHTLRQKSAAGVLARSALPFVIVIPIALGWLFIRGREENFVDRGTGIALLVLALLILLCCLLWRSAAAVASHERVSQNREARFRSYFELGLIGMVISSPDKRMIEVNDEFCRMLGHDRDELLKLNWSDITHPDDMAIDGKRFERVVAGESDGYSLEKRFLRKDKRVVHTIISVRCVRRADGAIDHFVALVQDITQRKRSEEILRQRTRSLELINKVGSTLAGELNLEKLVQAVTDAGREVTGAQIGAFFYTAQDAKGGPVTLHVVSGVPPQAFADRMTSGATSILHRTFHAAGIIRLNDAMTDKNSHGHRLPDEALFGRLPVRSYLSVPVISRSGDVLGGLLYVHSQPGVFTDDAERIVVAIASQAAMAIDNAQLYRKAQMEIAERKRAEEAKGRLAAIVEHSDDAIISKDLNGIITSWNRSAERTFGYRAEETIGRSILILIPIERHPEETTILDRIRRGEAIIHFETVRKRKNGSLLDVSLTVSPVRDDRGDIIGVSKIARDITERKRTERQQQALFDLVATINRAAAMPEILAAAIESVCRSQGADRAAILLRDEDNVLRFKAWRNLSDPYRNAAEGHSPWRGDEVNPPPVWFKDIQASPLPPALKAVAEQEGIGALAFIPLTYEQRLLGKFMLYYNTPHDFTAEEIRQAQTIASQVVFAIERQKSGEALEQLVNQRTASLREAIAQMEEFSYTVSHDLRAPLRGMKVYSETLLEDYSVSLPDEAHGFLKRIAANADRLDKMILDVLTFSRIARVEFRLERVALDKLVHQIVEQYPGMQSPAALIEIEPLPDVLGHEPSLTQALSNLLTNAVKFVAPEVRPHVRVWSERQDDFVRLWVSDNGIGIDPRYQRRLFGMFERIHPSLNYEGTGVGLAIVRKAAERMGGRVGMESDGKQGSRFWIDVKAVDAGAEVTKAAV
ncbi:MAG TPA: PAS domain S-box protein [Verrucomicrobiae bacterium]|nr:PAS domain S-box protein [Verrucomicrobiae bacterium]